MLTAYDARITPYLKISILSMT